MQIPEPVQILGQLGVSRAFLGFHGHLLRDPLALLFTPGGRIDPYPTYERIRAKGPLVKSTTGSMLCVDHAVCHQILRSRDYGVAIANQPARVVDLSLLTTDPPDHTRLRRLVAPAFAPARMRLQETRIREAVDRLLDDLVPRLADGPVDLIEAYAKPLPVIMIASLLGIPDSDLPALARHGDAIGGVLDGLQSMRHYRAVAAGRQDLDDMFQLLATELRSDPGPGVLSDLVAALDRGELTTEEYNHLSGLLLVAGFETTVNLIGNAMSALLVRPDLWRRLTADPSIAAADRVIEETLRWDSPVQATARVALTDVELAGRRFPAGQVFSVFLGGANRDPNVFDEPAVFDIDRPNADQHLSFSQGIHHCVGRPLAMLEGRIALTSLAARLPELKPAGRPSAGSGYILRGRSVLPVRV